MTALDLKMMSTEYDELLFNLISHLGDYKSYKGGEGSAYFIDNNFVVKEYTTDFPSRDAEMFDSVFDMYCREMQEFSEQGFSVPKIYAWLKVPNLRKDKGYTGEEMPYKYYILEENMPGRWIYYFYEDLDEMYNTCKRLCSRDDFSTAIGAMVGKRKLKKEILKAYISDYIKVNTMLESMGNGELEKFIVSAYRMAMEGTYSSPDLFRKNVLITDSKISLIDNRFRSNMGYTDPNILHEYFLQALFDLIEYNKFMDKNLLLNAYDKSLYDESIGKLIAENRKVCIALTQKILNVLNKKMGISPVRNKYVYEDIEGLIQSTFEEDADKILPLIHTQFEK